jgi:hypothetical protein
MCDTGSPIVATVLNQPAHRYSWSDRQYSPGNETLLKQKKGTVADAL